MSAWLGCSYFETKSEATRNTTTNSTCTTNNTDQTVNKVKVGKHNEKQIDLRNTHKHHHHPSRSPHRHSPQPSSFLQKLNILLWEYFFDGFFYDCKCLTQAKTNSSKHQVKATGSHSSFRQSTVYAKKRQHKTLPFDKTYRETNKRRNSDSNQSNNNRLHHRAFRNEPHSLLLDPTTKKTITFPRLLWRSWISYFISHDSPTERATTIPRSIQPLTHNGYALLLK